MGFLGLYDYEKAGSGVAKDGPQKKRVVVFFEIFLRKFWKLISLNMLFVLFCIPVVTIGPAMAGAAKVLRNFSQERHAFLFSDFWGAFKRNFGKAFLMGLIDLIAIICIGAGCIVYPMLAKGYDNMLIYIPLSIILALGVVLVMMNFYSFLMIVTTNISFKNILKNSLFLTFLEIKNNVITFLIVALISLVFGLLVYVFRLLILLAIFIPFTIIGLVVCFNCYPVIRKYVIDPYYEAKGEESPEFAYLKPKDDEETVFSDMGGKEAPIVKDKQKKKQSSSKARTKGKTIR